MHLMQLAEEEKKPETKAEAKRRQKMEEARKAASEYKARQRMLGNIQFIGQLYNKGMLTERIMHECIVKLFGGVRSFKDRSRIRYPAAFVGVKYEAYRAAVHQKMLTERITHKCIVKLQACSGCPRLLVCALHAGGQHYVLLLAAYQGSTQLAAPLPRVLTTPPRRNRLCARRSTTLGRRTWSACASCCAPSARRWRTPRCALETLMLSLKPAFCCCAPTANA